MAVLRKIFRAERFGIESKEVIESKKNQRAARFGLEANGKPKDEADEKKRARAERFGSATNGSGGKKVKYREPFAIERGCLKLNIL